MQHNNALSSHPNKREEKSRLALILNWTTAFKPNYSFWTFAALIILSLNFQTFHSVWHKMLITPMGQNNIMSCRRKHDEKMTSQHNDDCIIYIRLVMYLPRCHPSSSLRTQLLCVYCKNNTFTSQSLFVIAHLQRVKYVFVCVFCNELWGQSKQFIRWNLDPVSVITAVAV